MNSFKVKAFGITRDIVGGREIDVRIMDASVAGLRAHLEQTYPRLKELRSLLIAINNEYAEDALQIETNDEIALIPPVSGG